MCKAPGKIGRRPAIWESARRRQPEKSHSCPSMLGKRCLIPTRRRQADAAHQDRSTPTRAVQRSHATVCDCARATTGRPRRHGRCQHQRQGLEQQSEATPFTRPGYGDLRHLTAGSTRHSRHLSMQMRFVLEEIHMAPRALQAVVKRLCPRPTGWTSMSCCAKFHLKIDPPGLRQKGDLIHLPRSSKAQGLGEQRFEGTGGE
jgi:hypothetical protein